ncbi:hypothetical protein [Algoriphagus machipongonensis]|uniref:hypothetical protein n=1 Tax=Algoriphagus machipongonensis TaxID=388413 RepID=UPI0000F3A383|nr:hypothetical protein [Algoriphagus machipongonensis]
MERDLITQALQKICVQENKHLREVQQYLIMKYRIDADQPVLKRRLEKLLSEEKAVA